MGRRNDNAPVGNTCPAIDEVITFIDSITPDNDIEIQEIAQVRDLMEDIRSANSQLRDWGNEKHIEAEELETEKEILENELSQVIKDLKNVLSEI